MSTFIIAEAGSSHDLDMTKARRLIEAAKECGADAVKFQWTSSGKKMAERRGHPEWAKGYEEYLELDESWLYLLKATCDEVGIEFMCTVYLIEDIATIAPLVKRFKVSAFEATWADFINAHGTEREVIISLNPGNAFAPGWGRKFLHCISKYPTGIEDLNLENIWLAELDGLSDHTANVLTGAAAVAAGAKIIEAHIRLESTDKSNPDYGHSLIADRPWQYKAEMVHTFWEYVQNIRTVERML